MDSKKIAQAHFKNNQEAKEIFVTSDGQAFVSGNYADLHANSNREGKKMKVLNQNSIKESSLIVNILNLQYCKYQWARIISDSALGAR